MAAELWRYPVKSLRGERLDRASLGPRGVEADRGLALRDAATGRILSAKRVAALLDARARIEDGRVRIELPDGSEVGPDDDGARALSALAGRSVGFSSPPEGRSPIEDDDGDEFYSPPGTFFDGSPVHLVTTATLRHLERLAPGSRFDARRFRPNLVVDAPGEGPVEQGWIGSRVRAGSAVLEVFKGCHRCVLTTHAQWDLPADREILRATIRETDQIVGVYARVLEPGDVSVGDVLVPA